MFQSLGARYLIIGLLALLMFIPLFFVGEIVGDRANYSRDTIASVGREWGGAQVISGPVLVIPVEETIKIRERRDVVDPVTGEVRRDPVSGQVVYEYHEEERVELRNSVYVFPGQFDVDVATETEIRHRGIFRVPVYRAVSNMKFDFPLNDVSDVLKGEEVVLWDQAEIRVHLLNNRALRGEAALKAGDKTLALDSMVRGGGKETGIFATTGDPRKLGMLELTLGFNGAGAFSIQPVGRDSKVTIRSDCAHPSFIGAYLPDGSKIGDTGFTATWTIPHFWLAQHWHS